MSKPLKVFLTVSLVTWACLSGASVLYYFAAGCGLEPGDQLGNLAAVVLFLMPAVSALIGFTPAAVADGTR